MKSKASQKSGQDIHRDLHIEQPQRESLCEREAGPPILKITYRLTMLKIKEFSPCFPLAVF